MGKELISRTTFIKGVTACVVVAASLGILTVGEYSVNSSEGSTATSSTSVGSASYTPGTYTATSAGISSDVTVTCTFDEGSITDIAVDVSGETAGLGADIGDEMIEKFLSAQSASVDGVSGATITSDALKSALEDCIAQATGGTDGGDTGTEAETETEAGTEAAETETADADTAETETADADTAETEATETETADAEAVGTESADTEEETSTASSGNTYTPGTYTAAAAGISSDVTVTISVDEESILSVECDVSGETAGIGADIGDEISEQILTAQSADVDGVSGATVTSDAVKAAVADALAQAMSGTAAVSEDVEAETEAIETETVETEAAETEADETEAVETETAETEATETEAAETEAKETEATETEATETEAAETEAAQTEAADTDEETSTASSGSTYTPGVYSASAAGIDSDVTVTISVDEESILSVGCDVSGETAGIGADIGVEMSAQILTAQSADVDGVSGATVTSDAVKAAAADALAQAMSGTAAVSGDVDAETEAIETEAVETEAAETEAAETEAAETEVTETLSTSAEETGSADGSVLYTPGTYTASAEGISSTITVNVTFDETGMYRIDYDLSGETAGLGADIGPEITSRILEAQSVDVDGVSGATVTSDAVKQAVEDCIAQALIVNAEDDAETEEETEAAETDAAETEAESEASEEETTAGNVETEEEAETDLADGSALYLAGTYTATAEGYSTEVTVAMTFDENNIVEMDADVSGETSTWALIDDDVVAQVLEAQSVDVDGISGATVTTDAILEAAEDCIAQAMIEEDDSDSASTIIGGADTPTEIYLTDNSSDAADAEDGAETEESDAEEESGAAAYIPGTYTATAEGISSTITVSVTFDETRIYRIDYDLSGETAGLGADIGPEITAQILEAQSVDVDGVSGATVTSDAVKQAVEDCIKQAQGSQE